MRAYRRTWGRPLAGERERDPPSLGIEFRFGARRVLEAVG
jgi:hypothetical protein